MSKPCKHPPNKLSHETEDDYAPLFGSVPIAHREYVVCEACGARVEENGQLQGRKHGRGM